MSDDQFPTRYPNYNVLDKWSSSDWDDQTREVVRRRLEEVPPICFFTEQEAKTLTAIADRILPQFDRSESDRVPIVPWIDRKLYEDTRDGYRYEDVPPQREAWRLGLKGVDETAQALFDGKGFVDLDALSQEVVLTHIARGDAAGSAWKQLPPARFFGDLLCITIVKIYYAHPLAWNEIGYNGPSSVAILDAGPHWDPVKDFVSDEIASRALFWTDERITGGDNPIELGSNNSGQGVGGSTVHYSMGRCVRIRKIFIATLSAAHKDRPPCVYRGFCNYGCTTNAKSSILVTYIPRAIAAGAEVRPNSMVAQIEHNDQGHVTGVLYFCKGSPELYRQRARNVVVAGYAVETPRLLLNSSSPLFPDGLANSSGLAGKCFMVHTGEQAFAKFRLRINQYKAPPPGGAITEHFNRTMPEQDFICGYAIEVVGPHPADFAARVTTARGIWGAERYSRQQEAKTSGQLIARPICLARAAWETILRNQLSTQTAVRMTFLIFISAMVQCSQLLRRSIPR